MKRRIYIKPKLELMVFQYLTPFCMSPETSDAGGTGEDFEWAN